MQNRVIQPSSSLSFRVRKTPTLLHSPFEMVETTESLEKLIYELKSQKEIAIDTEVYLSFI